MIPLYYHSRSLWSRRLSTGLTVGGLSLVVYVFATVLMFAHGIEKALAVGGSPQNVVLLRKGATSEVASGIDRDAVRAVATLPEVARSVEGVPLAAGEVVVLVALPRDGAFVTAPARGIVAESIEARASTVSIVEGRWPRPGSNEIALGSSLVGRVFGAFVGGELQMASQRWPIVGRFAARGSAFESEIWADRQRLGDAFERSSWSSAIVRLTSEGRFDAFRYRLETDARFGLHTTRESAYWEGQATATASFIRALGLFATFVFSFGAVLGAMITLYAQVASRTREIGTLRALGFRQRSVLAGFLLESLLLGVAGGGLGALAALAMKWVSIRTLNFQTFSEMRFSFDPTPGILAAALAFGAFMGLAGGLLPALRAARLDILEAVRA
jgi:ABC-type lipoprotein release transport system permease subunit